MPQTFTHTECYPLHATRYWFWQREALARLNHVLREFFSTTPLLDASFWLVIFIAIPWCYLTLPLRTLNLWQSSLRLITQGAGTELYNARNITLLQQLNAREVI